MNAKIVLLLILLSASLSHARRLLISNSILDTQTLDAKKEESIISDSEIELLLKKSSQCANKPVSGFTYRATKSSDAYRLGSNTVEAIWNSKRSRTVNDITLCTQFDRSRIHMLEGQCRAWGGPLSAAVYIPRIYFEADANEESVESLKNELSALHSRIEAQGDCILDIVLISEMRMPEEAWSYPYNLNRNHAISRAKTKLVFLLDIDFLPNEGLRASLLEPTAWNSAIKATYTDKQVIVLPAFETNSTLTQQQGLDVAYQTAASTKQDIKPTFDEKKIVQFAHFFKRGHGATNYTKWFSTSKAYQVEPEVGYEPFIILSRLHLPYFDERFRGYGWDKISHIQALFYSGFQFTVDANNFVIHRPHPPSQGYYKSFTGPAYTNKHKPTDEMKKMDIIGKEMMKLLKRRNGSYPRFGVTSLASCHPLEIIKH